MSRHDRLLAELSGARLAVPFDILGLKPAEPGPGLRLLVWQPDVHDVEVIDARDRANLGYMSRVPDTDLFELALPTRRAPFPYTLKLHRGPACREIWDPYAFGDVLATHQVHDRTRLHRYLGSHPTACAVAGVGEVAGVLFSVYAPLARSVNVVGDFNAWDGRRHPMQSGSDGIWRLFVPGLAAGTLYKYEVRGPDGNLLPRKADPFARYFEQSPGNASIVCNPDSYAWQDRDWLDRDAGDPLQAPMAVYEVHLGSWRHYDGRPESYRQLADTLVPYVEDLGYTHIELLPVTEHPFTGSWGYQPTGLFAPTSRYGPPEDFKYFIDRCHQAGIGVILDWVPAHFPSDEMGLGRFDGTPLYEHPDPRRGWHPDWDTLVYDFGREYVQDFLISSALCWLEDYHLDGIRVDAVASMLYLDYSRGPGEWMPNQFGGNENLEAIQFLRRFNETVYRECPKTVTIAEESTAWPKVSRPTYEGGLGFGFKWNMGWMHDTLRYMSKDPIYRKHHQSDITFSLIYAYNENFLLPLSHDEVVHGKGSLLGKMPGDRWQQFANLRAYYAFMYAHPGKKMLFMGGEIAQQREWNHDAELDWGALEDPMHRGVQQLVRDLNRTYVGEPSLFELDQWPEGFEWIDLSDVGSSIVSFVRYARDRRRHVVVVSNMTPVVRENYRLGTPSTGYYREALNTDAGLYGGSNVGNLGGVQTDDVACHNRAQSLAIRLPPLATVWFAFEPAGPAPE
jgi:1,4-alpha-glucan branching enzyme